MTVNPATGGVQGYFLPDNIKFQNIVQKVRTAVARAIDHAGGGMIEIIQSSIGSAQGIVWLLGICPNIKTADK